jgi:hypothetical protein
MPPRLNDSPVAGREYKIAAWAGKARNQPELNRVVADAEDDGNRRGRRLCRRRCRCTHRYNQGDPAGDQIGRQYRQPVILIRRKAIFDSQILSIDEPCFFQSPM